MVPNLAIAPPVTIAFPNLAEKFLEDRKAKEENVVTYSIVEC